MAAVSTPIPSLGHETDGSGGRDVNTHRCLFTGPLFSLTGFLKIDEDTVILLTILRFRISFFLVGRCNKLPAILDV